MPRWTSADIAWDGFLPDKLDPGLLRLVKAAALTEYNAADYTAYLKNVFATDREFLGYVEEWEQEEVQHGAVLGRYAEMADPSYDFEKAFGKFRAGYSIPIDATESVRGSRSGELQARCIVETGTSSFYTAIADATEEPVLKEICRKIAADEFRHYRTFLERMRVYQPIENVSLFSRIKVSLGRVKETEDDELPFAYHCANEPDLPYDRERCYKAYSDIAYSTYRYQHTERVVGMIFKATGLNPQGWMSRVATRLVWKKLQDRLPEKEAA